MVARIAQVYGFIIVWHALRHFCSYPLLGSQSFFENPRTEWLVLGLLQVVVGGLLLYKPKPWHLILAAIVTFFFGVAYPIIEHVGDALLIMLLLGLAVVQLAGDRWIPLATAYSTIGLTLAGLCKLHSGTFSICNLTNLILLRFPWMDGMKVSLNEHETITKLMSHAVTAIELASVFVWILLFFPKLWLLRSVLAFLPISLLLGIGLTGNLDEFPWTMLTASLLMLGPKQPQTKTTTKIVVYPLALVLCVACFFNLEVNLSRIYFPDAESVFNKPKGLLPQDRIENMALTVLAPPWSMYTAPIRHVQMFGGETNRILKLETRIKAEKGCGLALDRWERIYWEKVVLSAEDPELHGMALKLKDKYKALEGRPCSVIVFPAPPLQKRDSGNH